MPGRVILHLVGLVAILLVLTACGGEADSLADIAPLDAEQPTFIYFYTVS